MFNLRRPFAAAALSLGLLLAGAATDTAAASSCSYNAVYNLSSKALTVRASNGITWNLGYHQQAVGPMNGVYVPAGDDVRLIRSDGVRYTYTSTGWHSGPFSCTGWDFDGQRIN